MGSKGALSLQQTSLLLETLQGSEEITFEAVATKFHDVIPKSEHFKACCALTFLLQDPHLLLAPQRLRALFILHDVYKGEPLVSHPFLSFLVEAATAETVNPPERMLALHLLSSQAESGSLCKLLAKKTLSGFVSDIEPAAFNNLPNRDHMLRKHGLDRPTSQAGASCFKQTAVLSVVADPEKEFLDGLPMETELCYQGTDAVREKTAAILLGKAGLHGFEAPYVRPKPPVLRTTPGELKWLLPTLSHKLLWDSHMCADTSRVSAVRYTGRSLCGMIAWLAGSAFSKFYVRTLH
mmetsp:Transcript_31107/g.60047  ORF Transcript_31107/g.60047 Transcript_31107/m.60047 type:complete len:294 (-) Transcript_31107:1199-2080(-)